MKSFKPFHHFLQTEISTSDAPTYNKLLRFGPISILKRDLFINHPYPDLYNMLLLQTQDIHCYGCRQYFLIHGVTQRSIQHSL